MVSFTTSFLTIVLLAISQFYGVSSAPASPLNSEPREILARATPAAPHWAIYSDSWTGSNAPPDPSTLKGFNAFILSFYLSTSGAADNVAGWTSLTADQRSTIKSQYATAGISLMASAFGSTDAPASSGTNPTDVANKLADFVIKYNLDGIDIDFEDFPAWTSGAAVPWLITLTKQLRSKLPAGQYIITHAPIAAWFAPNLWAAGGYLAVDKAVGGLIDWYNLQFYSQAPSEYVTCDGLLNQAHQYPGSGLFEIAASGVALDKLVIGKPSTPAEASDYMSPSDLATCLSQAKAKGWSGGAMIWEYPKAGSEWITTARSLSWPVGAAAPPSPPTTTSPPATTPPSSGGSCGSAAPWSSTQVYTGGKTATYNGHLWTAQWWTEGETPTAGGVWKDSGSC